MHYYIGLDNGGTSTKAALFDALGHEIGSCGTATRSIVPKPDYVELDMEEMWEANCTVIKGVLEKTGVDPREIAGLGIAGHGKGLYLWGDDDRPLRRGIPSTDNRAYEYPVRWRSDGTEAAAFEKSCQHILSCHPAALLAWIRDNEPENYKHIKYVFACKDYIRFRLTGTPGAEMTDCSGSALLNLHTADYDPELLALYGLSEIRDALPPLCRAAEICGEVTPAAAAQCGLCPGTPVIGGMFDINACAIASGVLDEEKLCMIAGTWSINEYIRRTPVLDKSVRMNSLFALPGYYLIEESSPTSAGNLEWFIRQLLPELSSKESQEGRSIHALIDEWVEEIPPQEFVPVFLPFLMASNVHPNAKGTFVGMSASHTRKHLVRSIFEDITFCHRYHYEKLIRSRGSAPAVIRLSGGAARAAVWAQMFADVMQVRVETISANETGALGCAIAAAVATGEYPTIEEAAAKMSEVAAVYDPDPALKAVYDRKYAMYVKSIDLLDGLWDDLQTLIEG